MGTARLGIFTRKPWQPTVSLGLTRAAGAREAEAFLDVGGGSSVLVDHLLAEGFADVTVLDVSARSLASSRARLGADADRVHWVVADVLTWHPNAATRSGTTGRCSIS